MDIIRNRLNIKKKKEKKPRKKKPKREKKKKFPGSNLVKNITTEDMFKEVILINISFLITFIKLVESRVIKKLLPAKFEDFLGDFNLLGNFQERSEELMPDPSFAQLRQVMN